MGVAAAPHTLFGRPAIGSPRRDARVLCTARVTMRSGGSQVFRVFEGRRYREFFFAVLVPTRTDLQSRRPQPWGVGGDFGVRKDTRRDCDEMNLPKWCYEYVPL